MCGIFGNLSLDGPLKENHARFKAALNSMSHRGPDDWGYEYGSHFQFGHRRLSIIDPDPVSKQPFFSVDKRFVLTFNGEIYNYLELRQRLEAKGHRFRTASDTEVLLQWLMVKGKDGLSDLHGMFAFAFHDTQKRYSLLVRDRLGIKPLYFSRHQTQLLFASEPKAILSYAPVNRDLNLNALSSYFSFRYPILNDSWYQGISLLEPGTYLEIEGSGLREGRFFNLHEAYAQSLESQAEEAALESELLDTLSLAVRRRLVADVPVGAYLSGGVDSSAIAALMAEELHSQVKTFTIGFDEDGYNEFEYAAMVAKRYGLDHREIILSGKDYLDNMVHLIKIKDAPLSVPNEVPLFMMSRELKKHITVVLSGEGADEIFGGYGRIFRSCFDYERHTGQIPMNPSDAQTFATNFEKAYHRNYNNPLDHFLDKYRYTSLEEKKTLLSQDLPLDAIETSFRDHFQATFDQVETSSYLKKMMYTFEKIHLPGLLGRLDTATMAASVEGRVPFVDHQLVAFAAKLPESLKLRWNGGTVPQEAITKLGADLSETYDTPKYLLKKALQAKLPTNVLYRKKMGFPVPLQKWFGGSFNDNARDLLLSKQARERGLYNTKAIETALNSGRLKTDHGYAMKVWMLMNLEHFLLAGAPSPV